MSRVDEKNASFVKLSRVEKFIQKVGTYEEKIFQKRSEIREKRMRRLIIEFEDAAFFCDNNSVPTDSEILQNTKDLKEQLNKYIRQKSNLFNSAGFSEITNKIKLGTRGWKERYYKVNFSVDSMADIESKRKEVVFLQDMLFYHPGAGVCGYGSLALGLSGGHLVAVVVPNSGP
ncbi:5'-3' exoribonuclease 3-like [Senna tora]|uniref:5'-3' exoribonuclease 3-like n=1 Tax=Senna tora TaxID=362788 RepID=A0A834XIZ0_9FABA|nr:5'-3' exoribonuclease 3-like [Senna tora]